MSDERHFKPPLYDNTDAWPRDSIEPSVWPNRAGYDWGAHLLDFRAAVERALAPLNSVLDDVFAARVDATRAPLTRQRVVAWLGEWHPDDLVTRLERPMPDLYNQIYSRDTKVGEDEAHGWIQWKGTEVCMDAHCRCGFFGHLDAQFAYAMKCPSCGQRYAVGATIKLIPLETPEEVAYFSDDVYVEPD